MEIGNKWKGGIGKNLQEDLELDLHRIQKGLGGGFRRRFAGGSGRGYKMGLRERI